jgi:hypothetical protein
VTKLVFHFTCSCLQHEFDTPAVSTEIVLFYCFPFVAYCYSQSGLRQVSLLPLSVNGITVFFSNSALYGQAVVISAEPDLVLCFEIEGCGLRIAAFTFLPVEAELNGVGS